MQTTTTPTVRQRGPAQAAGRRFGYILAIAINVAILYLANRSPGWQVVPFLTDRTAEVMGIVNVSLVAGIVANAIYVIADPPRLRALGDLITLSIALAATVRVWEVFPFDFHAYAFDWELATRVVLVLAIVGTAIGLLVALVTFVRGRPPARPRTQDADSHSA